MNAKIHRVKIQADLNENKFDTSFLRIILSSHAVSVKINREYRHRQTKTTPNGVVFVLDF